MKIIIVCLLLMFPVVASAQNPPANGMDMGKMMQLAQEMQQCMAKINQTEIESFQKELEMLENELEILCKQGKRDEAQKKAIAYGKKIMSTPAFKQMQKCGEITKGFMPENSMQDSIEDNFDFSNRHVCDK